MLAAYLTHLFNSPRAGRAHSVQQDSVSTGPHEAEGQGCVLTV